MRGLEKKWVKKRKKVCWGKIMHLIKQEWEERREGDNYCLVKILFSIFFVFFFI